MSDFWPIESIYRRDLSHVLVHIDHVDHFERFGTLRQHITVGQEVTADVPVRAKCCWPCECVWLSAVGIARFFSFFLKIKKNKKNNLMLSVSLMFHHSFVLSIFSTGAILLSRGKRVGVHLSDASGAR